MSSKFVRKRTTKTTSPVTDSGNEKTRDNSKNETPDDTNSGDSKPLRKSTEEKIDSDVTEQTQVRRSAADADSDFGVLKGSYWLTRIVLIRYMGFIYFVAYLVSLFQNHQLLGKDGLLPANTYLADVKRRVQLSSPWSLVSAVPTLLWFVDNSQDLSHWFDVIAWTGLSIAVFMMITGAGNWPLLLTQWLLYHSLVNVGQRWFSFGWESQLLETGFLTVFLCPMLSLSAVPRATPPSRVVIFAYRWLIFRIMLGAGLIKIRGDKCWRNLTCMNYHYETQPVPNPMSYFMHQSPEFFHKFEVLSNHFVELLAPFFLPLTRRWCMLGGAIQILFQVVLIISGNLSFLNWLTILPSLACFDDLSVAWMFSSGPGSAKARVVDLRRKEKSGSGPAPSLSRTIRSVFNISLAVLIAYLSVPVVQNLLSPRQAMNTSFDPLRLVNTYGAFGSVTKKRTEVIFQGTSSSDPSSPSAVWEEYQFKCKPGDVYRRPCLISPYHYRLDWLMWFAAFQTYQQNPWLLHLAAKLLVNDEGVESLIAHNPFHNRDPPKFVRAEHCKYSFTKIGSAEAKSGAWWKRKLVGLYLPPVSLDMLGKLISDMGWPQPKRKMRKL
ncbi:lipase maturation factor 1 [Aplysia californica]|uniref:Lipase maturation factor n=1 Tax=Aplysia californica TaxID=6500 RepID=A0ABM0K4C9_APLCA|nr:lipase maturation factor 1 [Aplysia californica]